MRSGVFIHNDKTYNEIPSILNFNHIVSDFTFFNLSAEITTVRSAIVIHYIRHIEF